MDTLTKALAHMLAPVLRPVSKWLLQEERKHKTWHYEAGVVAAVLVLTALLSSPNPRLLGDSETLKTFLIVWLSAIAVFGSFLHAKVGYRMAETLEATDAPPTSCYEWSGKYWLFKELVWILVFLLSGATPAIAGAIIFILYPAWRRIHIKERARVRG